MESVFFSLSDEATDGMPSIKRKRYVHFIELDINLIRNCAINNQNQRYMTANNVNIVQQIDLRLWSYFFFCFIFFCPLCFYIDNAVSL